MAYKYNVNKEPMYQQYCSMKSRCCNPSAKDYYRYGGRGITLCDEWLNDSKAYIRWAYKNGWKKGLQIDRIDNDKGYSPDNCRFVTPKENCRNKSDSRYLTVNGRTEDAAYWAEHFGIDRHTIYYWMDTYGDEYATKRLKENSMPVHKRRVKCIETNIEFESIADVMRNMFGKYSKGAGGVISEVCSGNRPAYKGYHFEYVD